MKKINRKEFIRKSGMFSFGLLTVPSLVRAFGTTAAPSVLKSIKAPSFSLDCSLAPSQTGGPFYLAPEFLRQDITEGLDGHPMELTIQVVDVDNCEPVPNALVNIWSCDANGVYSSFGGTSNDNWLRGYQISDCNGEVHFTTIFPGWYPGRVAHIHFDIHIGNSSTKVSQMYFPDNIDDEVYTNISPYNLRTDGPGGTPVNPENNADDGITGTVLDALQADMIDNLEYDTDGNPLPVNANFVIGLNMSNVDVDDYNCTGTPINFKVFLEGAYLSGGMMHTNLIDNIPLNQPYTMSPYSYNGAESFPTVRADMVDWVLVESRTGTPNEFGDPGTTIIERRAGILLNDGTIVGTNGEALRFNLVAGESTYFAIRHRNHLDVLSAFPVTLLNDTFVDFTGGADAAWGTDQLKLSDDGMAMMFSGDLNKDGVIQTTDYDVWASEPAILDTYNQADANLDGTVQTTDFDKWKPNNAKLGSVEIQE